MNNKEKQIIKEVKEIVSDELKDIEKEIKNEG